MKFFSGPFYGVVLDGGSEKTLIFQFFSKKIIDFGKKLGLILTTLAHDVLNLTKFVSLEACAVSSLEDCAVCCGK